MTGRRTSRRSSRRSYRSGRSTRRRADARNRLTRAELIDKLARDLVRREPSHYRGHEDDARFRVSHTSPGTPDSLKELALSARIRHLISEDEYVAIAGERERIGARSGNMSSVGARLRRRADAVHGYNIDVVYNDERFARKHESQIGRIIQQPLVSQGALRDGYRMEYGPIDRDDYRR